MRELFLHLAIHLEKMPANTLVCDSLALANMGEPVFIYEGNNLVLNRSKFILALDSNNAAARVLGVSSSTIQDRMSGKVKLPIPSDNYGGGAIQLFAAVLTDKSTVVTSSEDDAHDIFMTRAGYETLAFRLDTNENE